MTQPASNQLEASHGAGSSTDDLSRIFNTALVASRAVAIRDFSEELYQLVESPAFVALLGAVRQLSRTQGISEREASEKMIETFRRLDGIWRDYLLQEGFDRVKAQLNPS